MKVVLYARVSSEKQADKDLSIPAQLRALRVYALKHEWDVVREFIDEAESARTANRPAFQEMIGLAKQKNRPFDTILVWKLSRFARNREDSIIYKSLLRRHDVQVVSMNEQIDDSPSGRLLEGIIEVIDEFYSTNLAQDTVRGMKENARRGYCNGSRPPFGYRTIKITEGRSQKTLLDQNEAEASIIPRLFQWYLDGESVRKIAQRLNQKGHRTRSGHIWSKALIYTLLRNEMYTGTFVWNHFKKTNGHKVPNPVEDVIRIPNHHPALIDQVTFAKVQALLEKRAPMRSHPREVSSIHLLSGLVYCGRCGSKMVATSAKSGRFKYYVCQRRLRQSKQACDQRMINTRKLESFVIDTIRDRILTEEHIGELLTLVAGELQTQFKENKRESRSVEKCLADVERRLSKLYQLLEDEKLELGETAPRLRELAAQRAQLEDTMTRLKRQAVKSIVKPPTKAAVRRYVRDLQNTLRGGEIMERRGFIQSFIKRITIEHSMAELHYTCPLTPPGGCKPLSEEVLDMVKTGSPSMT